MLKVCPFSAGLSAYIIGQKIDLDNYKVERLFKIEQFS